jgi:hypothetical protein
VPAQQGSAVAFTRPRWPWRRPNSSQPYRSKRPFVTCPRERRLLFVQLRVLGAALCLSFFLCSAASVQAQDAPSSFLTWLHRINRSAVHHRAPLPPLPRPRPAEFVPKPSEVAAPQQREAVAPKPSEAFPPKQPEFVAPKPFGAAAPNKASAIPD